MMLAAISSNRFIINLFDRHNGALPVVYYITMNAYGRIADRSNCLCSDSLRSSAINVILPCSEEKDASSGTISVCILYQMRMQYVHVVSTTCKRNLPNVHR